MVNAGSVVELRFGVLVLPTAPFPSLAERWRRVEEFGFDFLFAPDHARNTGGPFLPWFDGWTVVTAMALKTSTIRIGTLVSTPVLRAPTTLAKAASAVDHLSNGRLELGVGMGVEEFDHQETGNRYWPPRERAARFREYVNIVDGVLRSTEASFTFEGHFHNTRDAALAPPPVQRPRPPITIGGRSPTARQIAAERADCWNTFGLGHEPVDEIIEITRRRNRQLDLRCQELGRDPASLRRSLVMWSPLDPWEGPDGLERIVVAFRDAGIGEFIVMWPPADRLDLLERAAATITTLRT
jgi:alkanesulfonate monooxygenase SsuD/methylene tetrahydromethanopterin reductase-like flavin-dependent oxidoreductase (luciferase family)